MELHRPHRRRVMMSEEAYATLCKWRTQFEIFCQREFTDEEVILRALDCLKYKELDVADAYRKEELKQRHLREIEERHKDEPFYIKDFMEESEYRKRSKKDGVRFSSMILPDTLLDEIKLVKIVSFFAYCRNVYYEELFTWMLDALYEKEPFIARQMDNITEDHPELKKVLHKYRGEE